MNACPVRHSVLVPLWLVVCCAVASCSGYRPQPLPQRASALSEAQVTRLRIDPATMPLPELAAHRFDPSNGFDMDDVAMLAVVNNPDLRLARDDLGIAKAQAFAAGLLPDPQLAISSDYPGAAGFSRAFSYGLSMDVMAILTRSANRRSADAAAAKVDLGLLWQEWQVIAQAKQLFLKVSLQRETLPLLEREVELTQARWARMAAAQHEGNQTGDSTAAALTALSDARRQLAEAQRAAAQSRHDLNALLDIAPNVELPLRAPDAVLPPGDATLDTALAALPKRRPDLIALQWGYRAQEEKYRAAILNQFPSLSVGFVRSRDTSEIYTSGFQINLSLPLFNRNRGNVAIESATRQRLRDEYQIRLDQAQAEVAHLRDDDALLARQLAQATSALPGLETAARQAQAAFAQHDLTIGAYTDAQMAALTRRVDIATLSESLAEARVGLQALLGSAIPDAVNFTHAHEN